MIEPTCRDEPGQACPDGASCEQSGQCDSLVCLRGRCEPATCVDAVRNGGEVDIDCGGACVPCERCDDGIENGAETDLDCGGGRCAGCGAGQQCNFDEDCESRVCKPRNDEFRGGLCAP